MNRMTILLRISVIEASVFFFYLSAKDGLFSKLEMLKDCYWKAKAESADNGSAKIFSPVFQILHRIFT